MAAQRPRHDPPVVALEPDRRARRAEKRGGQLGDSLQDVVEARGRRELAAELEQRGRALRFAPRRLVQAGVLHRDGGVTGQYLEQPHVVLVELVEAELGHDDDAGDAGPVPEGDSDERLLDHRRPFDAVAELAVGGVADEQRFGARGALAGDADADADAEELERQRARVRAECAAERDRDEIVAVDDEHTAVVVIDQRAQLDGDLVADLVHIRQPVQLSGQALQHLHVSERAHVALDDRRVRPLGRFLVIQDDAVLALRLRGHHRRLRTGGELARVHRVLGTEGEPEGNGDLADGGQVELAEAPHDALRDHGRIRGVARVHDHAEFLTAEPANVVVGADGRAQRVGEQLEYLVADTVTVHVVDPLEVVDVEHEHGDRVVGPARVLER